MIHSSYLNPIPALASRSESKPSQPGKFAERALLGTVDAVFFVIRALSAPKQKARSPRAVPCSHYNCELC
jgi:hypothetical protein